MSAPCPWWTKDSGNQQCGAPVTKRMIYTYPDGEVAHISYACNDCVKHGSTHGNWTLTIEDMEHA